MTVCINSAALSGIDGVIIQVETRICAGIGYHIVGLAGEAVRESLYRVESAIVCSGMEMPRQKILVSLAPAGVRKEGAVFDLPVALGILSASGQLLPECLAGSLFTGELSLNGRLRPVTGVLSVAVEARRTGLKQLIVPKPNAAEAALVTGLSVYGFDTLAEVVAFLQDPGAARPEIARSAGTRQGASGLYQPDFAEVRGQEAAKRALEIMAADGHNALMTGPPGVGKTMLASRLPTILPPLDPDEALAVTRVHSVAGQLPEQGLIFERPFRSPHHTCSDISLIGGGPVAMPGEVSLAHHGILFLDELPEYKRRTLEVLRQPLEERQVAIARASYSVRFPADFVLLAAMNPCPCGYLGHPDRKCRCTIAEIRQYRGRLSGPLLDRIDLHISVGPVDRPANVVAETSALIRQRVIAARELQYQRARTCNAKLPVSHLKTCCRLDQRGTALLDQAMIRHQLSARAYDRILKVARTIADLAAEPDILFPHLAEAIGLRSPDGSGVSK